VDSTKPQATASFGRVVLADFSIVFVKALAGGVEAMAGLGVTLGPAHRAVAVAVGGGELVVGGSCARTALRQQAVIVPVEQDEDVRHEDPVLGLADAVVLVDVHRREMLLGELGLLGDQRCPGDGGAERRAAATRALTPPPPQKSD